MLFKIEPSSLQDRQAVVSISLSTSSSTLSLSEAAPSSPPFQLVLTVRIVPGTSRQPGRAITICTTDTVLDPSNPSNTHGVMSRGAFGPLRRINQHPDDPPKMISLGNWDHYFARREKPQDMRQREWLRWLTIPADGTPVQVFHDMPLRRIFQYEDRLGKDDVTPGELYQIGLNDGYVGTMWWCWGDLEGDLRDKKFSERGKGWEGFNQGVKKPGEEKETEDWISGEYMAELWFEGRNDEAVFQFME